MKITFCNNCPCLNIDYETGGDCNLDSVIRPRECVKSGKKLIPREVNYLSKNCVLEKVITVDNSFTPQRIEVNESDVDI